MLIYCLISIRKVNDNNDLIHKNRQEIIPRPSVELARKSPPRFPGPIIYLAASLAPFFTPSAEVAQGRLPDAAAPLRDASRTREWTIATLVRPLDFQGPQHPHLQQINAQMAARAKSPNRISPGFLKT
jgi:hypothetical protein